ncbi:MAG: type IV pilus biogenesis/stability protein PilW, partial [Betaproteobacteria bacterium]
AAIVVGGCTVPVPRSDPTYNRQPGSETSTQARARIRTELSGGYYARGQYDVALEELNGALRDDPNYSPAYGMLGLVYSALRDDAQAERYFMRSVDINPPDPEVRNNYGWFLCQRGREVQSLAQFELAINNPFYRTPDLALLNAGRCAAKVGDRKNAEAYLQRVLNVSPSNPSAHFLLTDIAYRAGDLQLARTRMRTMMAGVQAGPEALLIGVCIERKLGNQPDESSYAFQLRQRFPASKEVRLIDSGGCQ